MASTQAARSVLALAIVLAAALIVAGCGAPAPAAPAMSEGLQPVNGTQLYYQTVGAGAPLFVLHGGPGGSHRYFLPFLEPLADQYQLVFYDQRGTGMSDGKLELSAITIDQFVDDLDALRAGLGYDTIALMGHSWGAIIALAYAEKYPGHLSRLIMVDARPVSSSFLAEMATQRAQRVAQLSPADRQALGTTCARPASKLSAEEQAACGAIDARLRFYDPAKAAAVDSTIEPNTAKNAATVQSLITTSFNRSQAQIEAGMADLHMPTLIIHAENDLIPVASAEYLRDHIPGAQLTVIAKSDHFVFAEQPEQFIAAVRSFLGQPAAAR